MQKIVKKGMVIIMKKLKKAAVLLMAAAIALQTAGCSSKSSEVKEDEQSSKAVASEENLEAEDNGISDSSSGVSYTIGIGQFAQHGSLDNCKEGFIEGLKEAGIEEGVNLELITDNANADTGTAAQIADSYVSKKVDLICAIATPMAQSAYGSAMKADIPVIYTAVTDPVAAELADDSKMPLGNATGTSDKLPVEEQLNMIRTILPDAKKIGIMYTTSEINSVAAIEEYKNAAGEYGFEIVESAVSTAADIPLAIEDLAKKVDCINNLTDNTVVSALPVIISKADENNIPVFGSEIEQVKNGCLATVGLDYIALGRQTGEMAAKVLMGEMKASEMAYEVIDEASFYANSETAAKLNIEIPKELLDSAAEVFDKTEQ